MESVDTTPCQSAESVTGARSRAASAALYLLLAYASYLAVGLG